jgi:hypothetical protein
MKRKERQIYGKKRTVLAKNTFEKIRDHLRERGHRVTGVFVEP